MKTIKYSIILASVLLLISCESYFIELKPLDTISEAVYFKKPEHFEKASNDFYNKMISWRSIDNSNYSHFKDLGSDLVSFIVDYGKGVIIPETSDVYWSNTYKYIRANNILLQKANEFEGDPNSIKEYVAVAKFFRAWHHFFLVQRFGGVPIVTNVIDLNSPELFGKRNSRYEVIAQIIKDLDDAIPDLPLEQNISSSNKGKISKWAAMAFKARVLLNEATWMRYVGNTTDGDGIANGAGTQGYDPNNINSFLDEAATLASEIIEKGGYELWDYNKDLNNMSMYYLFCLEDEGSNPAGLSKKTNKEFILYNKYDFNLYQGGVNLSHTVRGRLAPSRKMMDMFLCSDGLPIDKSPLFLGYQKTSDEYKNRDFRLVSYFADYNTRAIPLDRSVKLTGASSAGVSGSGYYNQKFSAYGYGTYRPQNTESPDYPQIRLAEVYLIYAEALLERYGTLTDVQLNFSINKLRKRAGLPNLTNTFLIANDLDIKEEIRRERTIELFAENSRFLDLKRWGLAESALNEDICGSVIEGTEYENSPTLYTKSAYPYGEISVQTGKGMKRALLLDPKSNRNFKRQHYLHPLPIGQIQLNKNLLQNPGY